MKTRFYYTVSKIELPDHVTGSITDLESHKSIEVAINKKNELQKEDSEGWYDVFVNEMPINNQP